MESGGIQQNRCIPAGICGASKSTVKKGHLTDFTEDSLKTCIVKNSSGESVERQAVVVIYSKK